MGNISTIPSVTYRVKCGVEGGTVFFVGNDRLFTAFHVAGSTLDDNSIYVEIEEEDYECELTIVKSGKDIAILTLKDEVVSHEYGSLLNIPIEAKTHFGSWGCPNTLMGQAVGQSVRMKVDKTYTALNGDFDVYTVFEDEKHLAEYAGFSGLPVYTDGDKMTGIVTDIPGSHIGSTNIKSAEAELKTQGAPAEPDYTGFQEIAYGRKKYVEKLRKQIALAENRYKSELDVLDQSFETLFVNLWDIRNLEKHKEILRTGKQVFLSLQKTNSAPSVTPPDKTLPELDYNIGMQRDMERLKNGAPNRKTIEVALKKELLSWKQIHEDILYVINRQEKVYCTYGPVGYGKTHNMRPLQNSLFKICPFYHILAPL